MTVIRFSPPLSLKSVVKLPSPSAVRRASSASLSIAMALAGRVLPLILTELVLTTAWLMGSVRLEVAFDGGRNGGRGGDLS